MNDSKTQPIPHIVVAENGDGFHVILEVAITDRVFMRFTMDIVDNEERTYEIAHEIQDRLSVIWKE